MDFWFEKSTPANTAKKDCLTTRMKLTAGIIRKVWLLHPIGCAGLAYATIRHGKHQLYPTNPDGAYHGDGYPMEFPDNYQLEAPAILHLDTWNIDDTYPHTVYVRITVLRPEIEPWQQALLDLLAVFKRIMGVG